MQVNFISSKDTGETRTTLPHCYHSIHKYGVITQKLCEVMIQMILLISLFKLFLDNYKKEEQITTGGSDFIFESVELID